MTITSNILRRDYTANGVNTTFAFDFPIFYETNSTPKFSLEVIITDLAGAETTKIETTDYTITYNTTDYVNGVINQGNVVLNTAPILNYKVSILRKLNFTQNTDITTSGSDALPGTALEGSLDKLTLINLEIKENLNRVVRLPKSSSLTNIEFPIGSSQANQLIAINNDGTNLTTKDLADVGLAPVSTYIKTLLDDTTALQARTTLDAQQLNANLTALAGLTGASNKLFYFTGSGTMTLQDRLATTTNQGVSYLNNPITITNNASDANNDIDFSAGNAPLDDGSGQVLLSSTLVKRLDASWVAGTNQGGLFSGTKANSTKYYLFAITNGTINDAGFDISPTGANIPAGYKGSYRGMIKTDSSGNILAFKQNKNKFLFASQITEYSGTVASTYTNLTSSNVPLKDNIEAITNLYFDVPTSETNGRAIIFKDLVSGQQKQVIMVKPTATVVLFAVIPDVVIGLNSSGQFQYKSTDAATGTDTSTTGTFQIKLNGWIDNNIKL
jgi:hypothetical protein